MPCTLVTHFNHVQEITPDTGRIARTCRQFGIQFSNQAVLLKSVNDSVASQVSLWTELIDRGIHAHYLHHPDRVAGNARFRVSIRHGLEIYSGLLRAMGKQAPLYVLDLPDGTGKVPVASLISRSPGDFVFVGQDGRLSSYRDIDAPHQHKESLWM